MNEQQVAEQAADRRMTAERRHVRVWFGEHVIASYVDTPALAERYAHAMSRRYAGLRVTNDPVHAAAVPPRAEPLPPALIWGTVAPH